MMNRFGVSRLTLLGVCIMFFPVMVLAQEAPQPPGDAPPPRPERRHRPPSPEVLQERIDQLLEEGVSQDDPRILMLQNRLERAKNRGERRTHQWRPDKNKDAQARHQGPHHAEAFEKLDEALEQIAECVGADAVEEFKKLQSELRSDMEMLQDRSPAPGRVMRQLGSMHQQMRETHRACQRNDAELAKVKFGLARLRAEQVMQGIAMMPVVDDYRQAIQNQNERQEELKTALRDQLRSLLELTQKERELRIQELQMRLDHERALLQEKSQQSEQEIEQMIDDLLQRRFDRKGNMGPRHSAPGWRHDWEGGPPCMKDAPPPPPPLEDSDLPEPE